MSRKYRFNAGTGTLDSIRLGGALTRLTLNGDLQPSYATFPGGDQTIRAFTSSHGDMRISASVAYDSATDRRITYDAAGHLWRQLRFEQPAGYGGGHLYGYDQLGRLVADTVVRTDNDQYCTGTDPQFGIVCTDFWSSWWALSDPTYYAYDAVGNRTDNGGSYTTGNRIALFGGCTYQNNADGTRLTNACYQTPTNEQFAWDALGRLKWVMFDDQGPQWTDTVKFYYDAAGRLIRRDRNSTILNYYLWDGDNLYAELYGPGDPGNGNKLAEYSYYPGLDQLHAVIAGDTAYYAHTDGMGNVAALTGADQGLKRTYTYLPSGALYSGTDYAGLAGRDRARWKGALSFVEHGVEFYYLRNRWYEPASGRFLSEDPIGLDGGINPYVFAGNDPVNGRDPTGQTATIYMDWFQFADAWLWVNYGMSLWGALHGPGGGYFFDASGARPQVIPGGPGTVAWIATTSDRILRNLVNGFAQRYLLHITVWRGDAMWEDEVGGRCEGHEVNSNHCYNVAVDFYTEGYYGYGNRQIAHLLAAFAEAHRPDLNFGIEWDMPALGYVTGHVHFDIRGESWRWGPRPWGW